MASRRNDTADHIAVAGYKVASMLARVAPSPLLTGASVGVGSSLARAMKQNRAMVMRHLQRVDPSLSGKRLDAATQQAFASYTRYYLETFRLPSQSTSQIAAGHQVEGACAGNLHAISPRWLKPLPACLRWRGSCVEACSNSISIRCSYAQRGRESSRATHWRCSPTRPDKRFRTSPPDSL